jgi:DNA-binding PadR family transcriptional regulator
MRESAAIAASDGRRHDQGSRGEQAPMRSPVNWALLGLLIEHPTYAYDLAQRFERRYGEALELSNIGHVYTALGALEGRGLIEEIPGTREGRQPRPRYRATALGAGAYRDWLVALVGEEERRRRLFVLALGALADEPARMIDVLGDCERAWLAQGMGTEIASGGGGRAGGGSAGGSSAGGGGPHNAPDGAPLHGTPAVLARLLAEQERLAVGAKLEWVQYAREQLGAARRPGGAA